MERAWCVFEVLAALDNKVEVVVAFPPKDREEFERAMKTRELSLAKFMTIFGDVNVNNCQAALKDDRDRILAKIEGRSDVNDAVMKPLKEFYLRAGEAVARAVDAYSFEGGSAFGVLACAYQATGELNTSLQWWNKALAAYHACNAKDEEVAAMLNNIASVLCSQGKLDEALKVNNEALAIRQRALGSDHADVAITVHSTT